MAEERTQEQTRNEGTAAIAANVPLEEPLPSGGDPGGAHAKGYSADPRPGKAVSEEGDVPLASVPDGTTHIKQPEREGKVRPTGRAEGGEYTPNDRFMGSDR